MMSTKRKIHKCEVKKQLDIVFLLSTEWVDCGGAHEISGIHAPLFIDYVGGWLKGLWGGWLGAGGMGV